MQLKRWGGGCSSKMPWCLSSWLNKDAGPACHVTHQTATTCLVRVNLCPHVCVMHHCQCWNACAEHPLSFDLPSQPF